MTGIDDAESQAHRRATFSRGVSGDDRYRLTTEGWAERLLEAKSILDVGCGEGHFGRYLRSNFEWKGRLVGTDIHHYEKVETGGYDHWRAWNMNCADGLPEEKFDIIFICEALHCAESPRQTVRSLAGLLKPGGCLTFTTANPLSLASISTLITRGVFRDFQDHPDGWRYPTQLTPILPIDAKRILRECGLQSIELLFSNSMRIPGTARSIQTILPVAKGRWFSDCYRAVGQRPKDE